MQRIAIFIVTALSITSVFAQPAAADPPKAQSDEAAARKQIEQVIAAVRSAVKEKDGAKALEHFDVRRFMTELQRRAETPKLGLVERVALGVGLRAGIADDLKEKMGTWERYKIVRFELSKERSEAIVIVRSWDSESTSARERFWLQQDKDRWKIYDSGDLDYGFRLSSLLAVLLGESTARRGRAKEIRDNLLLLFDAETKFAEVKYDDARKSLARMDGELPDWIEGYKSYIAGRLALVDEDAQPAIKAFARAEKLGADFPIMYYLRALAENMAGQHEQALTHARKYMQLVGEDSDAYLAVGEALAGLGKTDEATAAYRKGLDDTPDSLDNLVALGLLLPKDNKSEIGERFRKMRDSATRFQELAAGFLDEEDLEAAQALIDVYRKMSPDDPNVAYYDAAGKYQSAQYQAAAQLLTPAFARAPDDEKEHFYELYLDCMLALQKPLDGYRKVPDKSLALRFICGEILFGVNKMFDRAPEILDEHAKQFPNDPYLHYFYGNYHYNKKELEKADQRFIRGLAAKPDESLRRDLINDRGSCWFQMGKGLKAYQTLGPSSELFDHLALLLDMKKDGESLAKLVAMHEQRFESSNSTRAFAAKAHFYNKQYEQVLKLLKDNQDEFVEQELLSEEEIDHLLVRSLLRTRKLDEALRQAKLSTARDDDPYHEVFVHAVRRDVAACEAALARCLELGYDVDAFTEDEDIGKILLTSDNFASLRAKHIDQKDQDPVEDDLKSLVLLVRRARLLTEKTLRRAVERAWNVRIPHGELDDNKQAATNKNGKDKELLETFVAVANGNSAIASTAGYSFFIHSRNETYSENPEESAKAIKEARTRKAYLEHRGWLAVDIESVPENGSEKKAYEYAARLLVQLSDVENGLIVFARPSGKQALFSAEIKEKMIGADPLRALGASRESPVVLLDDEDPAVVAATAEARRRWPEFVTAFKQRQDKQAFAVKVMFTEGENTEHMWIKVTEVEPAKVHGTLDNKPVWIKKLKLGDKTSAAVAEISDWVYSDAKGGIHGLFSRAAVKKTEQK